MKQIIYPVRLSFVLPVNEHKSVERFVYAYLALGERVCMIDTGPAGAQQAILDKLAALGRSAADIEWVIDTHEHPDHIGGNTFFQEIARPKFACHVEAVRWIENLELQHQERPIYSFFSIAGKETIRITHKLQDGDVIDLGDGVTLEVVYTPGHSPGSIALFCPQEGTLISADTIPPTGGLPLYTDVDQIRASLRRLGALPGVTRLYTSHSDVPYEGEAVGAILRAGMDYLERMDRIVGQLLRDLPGDASREQIAREALLRLGLDPPPMLPIVVTSVMSHVR
jgi:glyoxylase-like metal-dependent hydrolase (beta-lactamase superfamily II)